MTLDTSSLTLRDALEAAKVHWSGRPGDRCMGSFAGACVEVLGGARSCATLKAADAVKLLATLRETRAPKTVKAYYGAFRRMLTLADAGVNMAAWPSPPKPPRKTREAMTPGDVGELAQWMSAKGWHDTADLVRLLRATGLRLEREALDAKALTCTRGAGEAWLTLTITGKGGHMRSIPVVDAQAVALLEDEARMGRMRATPGFTHRDRWRKAVAELGIGTALATPHAVRHMYACEVYAKVKDIVLVSELLGHSDVRDTMRYVGKGMSEKAAALAAL